MTALNGLELKTVPAPTGYYVEFNRLFSVNH
jgi:hypothetical protein